MQEGDLANVVGLAYEAASGGVSWIAFGDGLCRLVGAHSASLRLPGAGPRNLLRPVDAAEMLYRAHYHRTDLYRARAASDFGAGDEINRARLGEHIVGTADLRRSEYYADYLRPNGLDHMLGGLIGLREPTPIGLHRDAAAGGFTAAERQTLDRVLPHLQRALQLRERIARDAAADDLGAVVLDALALAVVIVDGAMTVRHANAAAVKLMEAGRAGLAIVHAGPRSGSGGLRLMARHRADNHSLKRLVAAASEGGSGGAMRARGEDDGAADTGSLIVLVTPVPARFVAGQPDSAPGLARGAAMVVARDVSRPACLPARTLGELYGLTSAEAAVAVALCGAVTAEAVARARHVSLDTIRTQIRTVLRKTNAANLRDFERIMALASVSSPTG